MNGWTCICVEKGPGIISDLVRAALTKAACRLSLGGADTMLFKEPVCEGRIETTWRSFTVGSRAGILFRTELEAENGNYRVNFLLATADLKRGEELLRNFAAGEIELGRSSYDVKEQIPELFDFSDLSLHHFL